MAAEDKGAEDNKPEERQARARRQRPPVTIDLTAERVSEKGERVGDHPAAEPATGPASTESESTAAPQPEAPPGGEPATEAPAPPSAAPAEGDGAPPRPTQPSGRNNGGWTRPVIAGVIGAVVALVVLIGLQASGVVPSPDRSMALQAASEAKAASDAAAVLDRRVSAIETLVQTLPGKAIVEGLAGQVAQLQKEAGALATQGDLKALDDKAAALSKSIDGLASRDSLTALADRVARLEAGGATGGGGGVAGEATALSQRIDSLQSGLAALDGRVAALEGKVGSTSGDSLLAARAIAAVALKRAADEGGPFASDLDLAAALGLPADTVAKLRPYAAKGVETKMALSAAFPAVGDAIVRATTKANPNAGLLDRVMTGLGSLVTIRPTGPVAGNDPPAIVSRMQAAVTAGDLATALKERDALPDAGKAASADWAKAAETRVTVDSEIAALAQSVKPTGNGPT
jgi:hypothetical protein